MTRKAEEQAECYGCGKDVMPVVDDGERYCPRCGSTDLTGAEVEEEGPECSCSTYTNPFCPQHGEDGRAIRQEGL